MDEVPDNRQELYLNQEHEEAVKAKVNQIQHSLNQYFHHRTRYKCDKCY